MGAGAGRRWAIGLAIVAFLAAWATVGYAAGHRSTPAPGPAGLRAAATAAADPAAVADAVDDAVVNVTAAVEGGGRAAGSGIVISETGLVLTNNHVISGTTRLQVEFGTLGETRAANVLGYSVVDDVALLQVRGGGRVPTAELGDSSTLDVGDPIVVIGNAGGRGGAPRFVGGEVSALDRDITAADPDGGRRRTLDGLIEVAADVRSGDSGGAVVDADGRVVGMSVAATARTRLTGAGREGYAIPIEDALAIARRITSGEGGPDIRVGSTRAVLGVHIETALARVPGGRDAAATGGAAVVGVERGSGALAAGITEGDVIVALDDRRIADANELVEALVAYAPGETVEVTWRDGTGVVHRAAVLLGEGPPA